MNLRAPTNDWHHIVMVPLGLLYLSAAAKQAFGDRVKVALFDMVTCPPGAPAGGALRAFLEDVRPDVVGLRGFTSQAAEFPAAARLARAVNPGCLVIAGGPHASTGSRGLLEGAGIDLVAFGEGEETFVDVIGNVLAGRSHAATRGLGWLASGRPHRTPPRPAIADLDGIPFPDYTIVDLARYQGAFTMTDFPARTRFTTLFTSRGCPYRCTFCHDIFGKRVRVRSVENVLAEMEHLMEAHGVGEFHIVDDIFNADRRRALALFDAIVRRSWKLRLAFPNGLRGDRLDEEFIAAARAAGTYHWALAVETATPRLQKMIRKRIRLDRLRDVIALSDRHGVFTTTFNMLGFPTETEREMQATIDYNVASAAHVTFFFVVTPFEGTALHDQLEPAGAARAPDARRLGYMEFSPGGGHDSLAEVPRARIEELVREGLARFYFAAPRRIERMLALAPGAHDPVQLALYLQRRLDITGLTLDTVADRETARRLGDLFRTARKAAPEPCAHLPAPAPGP